MVWEEVTDDEQGPSYDDSMLVPSSYRPSKVKSPLQDRTNTTTTANLGDCEDDICDDNTKQKSSKQITTDGVNDKKTSTAVSSKGTGKKIATVVVSAVTTGKQQQSMMSFFNKKA